MNRVGGNTISKWIYLIKTKNMLKVRVGFFVSSLCRLRNLHKEIQSVTSSFRKLKKNHRKGN